MIVTHRLDERSPGSEGFVAGGEGPVWRTPEIAIAVLVDMTF
jgi:hypothetical protein